MGKLNRYINEYHLTFTLAEKNREISAGNSKPEIANKSSVNTHNFDCKKTIFNNVNADALFSMFTADVVNKQRFLKESQSSDLNIRLVALLLATN